MKELRFEYCEICKKMHLVVDDKAPKTMCCGQPMKVLTANTVDAAKEKHVPAVELSENEIRVHVGSVTHPMTEEHHIAFIAVLFEDGSYALKNLDHTGEPTAVFPIGDVKPVAAYEYCNLHGLWKAEF